MELDETLAFVAVARDKSFTEAGRRLGVPKSTLSRRVSRLEERLGTRLLQRTTRRIGLTEIGEEYFRRCARAIETLEEAERAAADLGGRPRGTLRVTTSFNVGRDWLLGILPEFRKRHPDIDLVIDLSQRAVDLIEEGFDVAIRGGPTPKDSTLIIRRLTPSGIVLGAAPKYLRKHGTPKTLEDLADHQLIFHAAPGARWRLLGPDGMIDLPGAPWLTVNDFGIVQEVTAAGLGIGVLETSQAKWLFEARKLRRVLPAYGLPEDSGGSFAVYPSRHLLTPKVRVFIDFLVENVDAAFCGR